MPTDGTLILEQLPNNKKYLVTALTAFFSIGAVFTAIVALIIVPRYTCFATDCDVAKDNLGWKYLLVCLCVITLLMTLFRVIFFRLYESPRFLVAAGRPAEAMENLQLISKFNGEELDLSLRDVRDHFGTLRSRRSHSYSATSPVRNRQEEEQPFLPAASSSVIFNADAERGDETTKVSGSKPASPDYNTTGETSTIKNNTYPYSPHALETSNLPSAGSPINSPSKTRGYGHQRYASGNSVVEDDEDDERKAIPRSSQPRTSRASASRRSSVSAPYRSMGWLPRFIRKPLWAYMDRIALVLTPEWIWKTLTVWAMWFSMALAYTMFNAFLPKLLEKRLEKMTPKPSSVRSVAGFRSAESSLEASLWDVVIYSIGGCPGAILGAYLVGSSFGRRWSLAGSTFLTAFFCAVFVRVDGHLLLKLSTVGISLASTTMWGILYGWTPEIFSTNVRGSACGIASALSRIGGMIAPILGGQLLTVDVSLPVYTSVVTFVIAGICVLFLKEAEKSEGEETVILH